MGPLRSAAPQPTHKDRLCDYNSIGQRHTPDEPVLRRPRSRHLQASPVGITKSLSQRPIPQHYTPSRRFQFRIRASVTLAVDPQCPVFALMRIGVDCWLTWTTAGSESAEERHTPRGLVGDRVLVGIKICRNLVHFGFRMMEGSLKYVQTWRIRGFRCGNPNQIFFLRKLKPLSHEILTMG